MILSVFINSSKIRNGAFKPDSGWVILTAIEAEIKRKIEAVGIPLKDWDINIFRGILTGYNEAFIIDGQTKDKLLEASPKNVEIIRPYYVSHQHIFQTDKVGLLNSHLTSGQYK